MNRLVPSAPGKFCFSKSKKEGARGGGGEEGRAGL